MLTLNGAVILPHPVDTEDGMRLNRRWIVDNNAKMKAKAKEYLART
jgi:hypothetical protein